MHGCYYEGFDYDLVLSTLHEIRDNIWSQRLVTHPWGIVTFDEYFNDPLGIPGSSQV